MYVPDIHDHISQIGIEIYEGAAHLAPSASDTVSSFHLQFRQV